MLPHLTGGVKLSTAVVVSDLNFQSIQHMIDRSASNVKDLRIALDGCYPSFWHTDLVMRSIRCSYQPKLVSRLSTHDLLIRGPFSRGSKRLRVTDAATQIFQRLRKSLYQPLTLHVSSENHTLQNYQSYIQSGCDYGIGHELDKHPNYLRSPHWHNYVDFSSIGINGPVIWPRLGKPMQLGELSRPIQWNDNTLPKAAFVCSNLTSERTTLMTYVNDVIPVDGYGKAFNAKIPNHSQSGFVKRELLANYQYCFCPENSLSPGYYTEKIPEAYVSGAIPITHCDSMVNIDFSPEAIINLQSFFDGPTFNVDFFRNFCLDPSRRDIILSTPLISYDLADAGIKMLDFTSSLCSVSLS